MDKYQFGITVVLALITIGGVAYNIIKTHVLTYNHISHLSTDVKEIKVKLEEIDNTQVNQGKLISGMQATCTERGKQLEKLT